MKKEGIDELRKIFEKNSKKVEDKEKEKTKENERGEKEKTGSVYEKNRFNDNIRDNKNNINRSVYINSTNIDKMKNIFNNQVKNTEKSNELENIRKSLVPVKEKKESQKEDKKIEFRKSEKIEFKKLESSEFQKQACRRDGQRPPNHAVTVSRVHRNPRMNCWYPSGPRTPPPRLVPHPYGGTGCVLNKCLIM
jgi:hypothetical protein